MPGLTYELVDGEIEVAPGLRLIPTPGHTPGHQSLAVATSEGTVVFAGQAVRSSAEWGGASGQESSGYPSAPDQDTYAVRLPVYGRLILSACTSRMTPRSGNAKPSGRSVPK